MRSVRSWYLMKADEQIKWNYINPTVIKIQCTVKKKKAKWKMQTVNTSTIPLIWSPGLNVTWLILWGMTMLRNHSMAWLCYFSAGVISHKTNMQQKDEGTDGKSRSCHLKKKIKSTLFSKVTKIQELSYHRTVSSRQLFAFNNHLTTFSKVCNIKNGMYEAWPGFESQLF